MKQEEISTLEKKIEELEEEIDELKSENDMHISDLSMLPDINKWNKISSTFEFVQVEIFGRIYTSKYLTFNESKEDQISFLEKMHKEMEDCDL